MPYPPYITCWLFPKLFATPLSIIGKCSAKASCLVVSWFIPMIVNPSICTTIFIGITWKLLVPIFTKFLFWHVHYGNRVILCLIISYLLSVVKKPPDEASYFKLTCIASYSLACCVSFVRLSDSSLAVSIYLHCSIERRP